MVVACYGVAQKPWFCRVLSRRSPHPAKAGSAGARRCDHQSARQAFGGRSRSEGATGRSLVALSAVARRLTFTSHSRSRASRTLKRHIEGATRCFGRVDDVRSCWSIEQDGCR